LSALKATTRDNTPPAQSPACLFGLCICVYSDPSINVMHHASWFSSLLIHINT